MITDVPADPQAPFVVARGKKAAPTRCTTSPMASASRTAFFCEISAGAETCHLNANRKPIVQFGLAPTKRGRRERFHRYLRRMRTASGFGEITRRPISAAQGSGGVCSDDGREPDFTEVRVG